MKRFIVFIAIMAAIGYNATQAASDGIKSANQAKIELIEGL